MKIVVKIGGIMIEKKTPTPTTTTIFLEGAPTTPTTAQFYLKRAPPTSTTIQLNIYTTHNHNNTTIL